MELHAFDHNLHSADAQDSHSHNLDINQSDHFNNDFNNSNFDINQNRYDYSQNHGLDYSNNHGLNPLDQNQFISDYQPPNFSNTISDILAGNHPESFHHDQFLAHDTQRLGSANFTPSSPSEISINKEVTFNADGHEQSGTVMKTNGNDTYTIQTSNGTYKNVAYHDIEKYGSK
jgi:hypothetical protein